jgi:hypothetical protein
VSFRFTISDLSVAYEYFRSRNILEFLPFLYLLICFQSKHGAIADSDSGCFWLRKAPIRDLSSIGFCIDWLLGSKYLRRKTTLLRENLSNCCHHVKILQVSQSHCLYGCLCFHFVFKYPFLSSFSKSILEAISHS